MRQIITEERTPVTGAMGSPVPHPPALPTVPWAPSEKDWSPDEAPSTRTQ